MPWFAPPEAASVCDGLELMAERATAQQQIELWSGLRVELNHQARSQGRGWAMAQPDAERLRALEARLRPADSLTNAKWLFEAQFLELPPQEGVSPWEQAERARENAIRDLYQTGGIPDVLSLAEGVPQPALVGSAFGAVLPSIDEFKTTVDEALARGHRLDRFVVAVSSEAERRFSADWRSHLQDLRTAGSLALEDVVTLLLGWSSEESASEFAASLGPDVEESYWRRKPIWPPSPTVSTAAIETTARKYLSVRRADAAAYTVHGAADRVSGVLLLEILDSAIEQFNVPNSVTRQDLFFHVEEIFEKLSKRKDIPALEIGKREYAYLPLLRIRDRSLVLNQLMADDPEFFVSILRDVYRPASEGSAEPDELSAKKAQRGYELLTSFEIVPGSDGRNVDRTTLEQWVNRVRELATEADRSEIADVYVGQVFAHAPDDAEDGAWPHRTIRDLLETLASSEVEHGIQVARLNMLGARAIDPKNPGADERHLAEQARKWAKSVVAWPRTSAMLNDLAQAWDLSAARWEEHFRQEDMRPN